MGLTGETVEQNVVNQQAIGRDERAKEIQLELIEYKAEKCKLDVERETVKLEHELARLNNRSVPEGRCEVEGAVMPNYAAGEDRANYLMRLTP